MRDLLFLLTALFLMLGCSSKEQKQFIKVYEKNKDYHIKLQRTEKINLKDGKYSKILLTATYLFEPSSDLEDKRDEKFIVGFYIDDEDVFVDIGDYEMTLNGVAPKSVKLLEKNDILLKTISFNSGWTHFYLFTFPHTKSKRFNLLFTSDFYGKGKLPFAKVGKYVFTKTPF